MGRLFGWLIVAVIVFVIVSALWAMAGVKPS
jgi:hypothetical protein